MASLCARRLRASVSLLVLAVAGVACRSRTIGESLRPDSRTAWEAAGDRPGQCREVSRFGEPLVVDWQAHQRANLEEAMHDGVAVVTYDCTSLRLLSGCRLEGSYGFMAVSKKEQTVRFEDADEVAANLPSFGLPLVKQLSGDLSSNSTLDLAMILVGKRRTTVSQAGRDRLVGGEACEGATHFVRGAFVGAFAFGTGTRGAASLGAGLFSGSSKSSKLNQYRDGEPDTCQQVKPGSDAPPPTCDAVVRLELVALSAGPAAPAPGASAVARAEARPPEDTCPSGLVLASGKCTRERSSEAHQCRAGDAADCTRQCDLGHVGSCGVLGRMYLRGEGVGKDVPRALALLGPSCEARNPLACSSLGRMYDDGEGVKQDKARAATLYEQSCDVGETIGCSNLGTMLERGEGMRVNKPRAALFYRQACDGGNAIGCSNLAFLHQHGEGVAADRPLAASLYQRSCEGGAAVGCFNLGVLHDEGEGVKQDKPRAVALYQQACDGGYPQACLNLGVMVDEGEGVKQDKTRAVALYRKACDGGVASGCTSLGAMYAEGEGVAKDRPRALALYQQACDAGAADGCFNLAQAIDSSDGADHARAQALYRKACSAGDASACKAVERPGTSR